MSIEGLKDALMWLDRLERVRGVDGKLDVSEIRLITEWYPNRYVI